MPHPKPTDLDMTKHSDDFVWKDTSEGVARRCDYTVDKKRVNCCVLKHLFLVGTEQPKISPKNFFANLTTSKRGIFQRESTIESETP